MTGKAVRTERVSTTREQIVTAAERLYAEHGVFAVSNRQVSEAAGQGNNAAVGYHFGTKTDLVRAITREHAEAIERIRLQMVREVEGSTDVRDWVSCLVRPSTEHLAALRNPTWFARFGAQIMTDPTLRGIMVEETLASPSLRHVLDRLNECLPELGLNVHLERAQMAQHLMTHMCAERERALAEGTTVLRATWYDAATGLIDAMVGMWLAPLTST